MSERFHYRGPATIDGVQFSAVLLREDIEPGQTIRSWSGLSSFLADDKPQNFTGNMGQNGPVAVELPYGRRGQVLVSNIGFDGSAWTVHLTGTGPAPE